MTYTSDSYAKNYIPEKSLYQGDARIFHQPGYFYDAVMAVKQAALRENVLTARLRLQSDEEAHLVIHFLSASVLRLRFWQGQEPAQPPSGMLVEQDWPGAQARLCEDESGWILELPEHRLHLLREPFGLRLESLVGTLIWELETENVAGKYITPPLGLRKSPSEAWGFLSWRMHNGERFFGFGEKWNKVEKTSTRATIWGADTAGTNTLDLSYKAVPVLYSTAGWGLMLHASFRSWWEVGTFSYTSGSMLVESDHIEAFLFMAPDLKGLIAQYTALTGRPQLPPLWSQGVWMSRCSYRTREQLLEVAQRLRAEEIPCDVLHIDQWMRTHYYVRLGVDACDFEYDPERWGPPEALFRDLAELGFKISLWINPYLPEGHPIYAEALDKGYLVGSEQGRPARLEFGEPVGLVDFTNPDAKEWWKDHLKELVKLGAGVFKPDYGDRTPEDAVFFNGRSGREMHNLYVHLYAEAAFEAMQEASGEGIVWRRPGYIGTQRYPGTWAGDTQVSWEGMQGALRGGLSAGFTGDAFWSHDIGGFVGPQPNPELYIRWVQFGMLSPFTRFHGTTPREPWEYGPQALAVARRYAQLRYSLMPYLRAAAQTAHESGLPILRHMHLAAQSEPGTEYIDDQYLLGPNLLVAPVLQAGQTERSVYFPAGEWLNLDEPTERFTGPRCHSVPAPLESIPVFVRAGCVLPCFDPVRQHLKGRLPEEITLDLYPGEGEDELHLPYGESNLTIRFTCRDRRASLRLTPAPLRVRLASQHSFSLLTGGEIHPERVFDLSQGLDFALEF